MLCGLIDFRNESKLALKLFFNTMLIVEELMVGAQMQIIDKIEKMLVKKVLVNEEVVKDSWW